MKRRGADFWSGLFLLLLSGAVINEALNLEVGTPGNPGSGFMIFGAAAALGLFALRQFIASLAGNVWALEAPSERIRLGRIVSVLVATLGYIVLLEPVGYVLATFLLLTFLFQVLEMGHWAWRTSGAGLTACATYVIFAKALQLNLPKGLLTFF